MRHRLLFPVLALLSGWPGRADALPTHFVRRERLQGSFIKMSPAGIFTTATIRLRLIEDGDDSGSQVSGRGPGSFRCHAAGGGMCPGRAGRVGTVVLIQNRYPASDASFEVILDAGGSCGFTGSVPFFDSRPIPAMSGTYRCVDASGADADAGTFILSSPDAAPRGAGSTF